MSMDYFFVFKIMIFDISSDIIYNTYDELREISTSLEMLLESSVDDIIWLMKLFGGKIIVDYSDHQHHANIFMIDTKGECHNLHCLD